MHLVGSIHIHAHVQIHSTPPLSVVHHVSTTTLTRAQTDPPCATCSAAWIPSPGLDARVQHYTHDNAALLERNGRRRSSRGVYAAKGNRFVDPEEEGLAPASRGQIQADADERQPEEA